MGIIDTNAHYGCVDLLYKILTLIHPVGQINTTFFIYQFTLKLSKQTYPKIPKYHFHLLGSTISRQTCPQNEDNSTTPIMQLQNTLEVESNISLSTNTRLLENLEIDNEQKEEEFQYSLRNWSLSSNLGIYKDWVNTVIESQF